MFFLTIFWLIHSKSLFLSANGVRLYKISTIVDRYNAFTMSYQVLGYTKFLLLVDIFLAPLYGLYGVRLYKISTIVDGEIHKRKSL